MSVRFWAAMAAGKIAMAGLELLGRQATYLPGKIAIKICPDFIGRVGKPEKVIGITGTNGKTTVSNLLDDALESRGVRPLGNRYGSNINAGVASSLLKGSSLSGRCRYELGVFELDERSAPLLFPYIKPDILLCLDLFRDSIKRNAHAEYISEMLTANIPAGSRLILPADDLIAAGIAPDNERVYFGIERQPEDGDSCPNLINDMQICPNCHALLKYDFVRYHHIGRAHCPECGFRSPDPEYTVREIDHEKQTMLMALRGKEITVPLISDSIFNISNEAALIAVLCELGWTAEQCAETMGGLKIVETRLQQEDVCGHLLTLQVAKGQNPVACSRVFDHVSGLPGEKQIILMLDDVFDARDTTENISWIYETDFEFLCRPEIRRIAVGGVRARDYYLRLLMAGVPEEKLRWSGQETGTPELLDYDDCADDCHFLVLYELYAYDLACRVRDGVKQRIMQAAGSAADSAPEEAKEAAGK